MNTKETIKKEYNFIIDEKIKRILWTEEEIIKQIKKFGPVIDAHYKNKEKPIFLGILKGCVLFYSHLITATTVDSETQFIKVSSYEGTELKDDIQIKLDTSIPVNNRNVLIIEDVIDSGHTLKKIIDFLHFRNAKEIKIISLINKLNSRKTDIEPDWSVFTLDTKEWLIGWGFDLNESLRNLPYIGFLKDKYK